MSEKIDQEKRKRLLFQRIFNSEDGLEVLRFIYEEAFSNACLESPTSLSYAFEAGKRSLWQFITAYASLEVDKFLDNYIREMIHE
jgi:hypothetical protein